MRRALVAAAVAVGALAAPASAGPGVFGKFAFASDCGFRLVCFDLEVHRAALAAAAVSDRFEVRLNVTYVNSDGKKAAEAATVKLPPPSRVSYSTVRAVVIVPRDLSGRLQIDAKATFVLVINRTGDRAFFVDETGVIRAEPAVPPCDDTDADPTNDCPGALNN